MRFEDCYQRRYQRAHDTFIMLFNTQGGFWVVGGGRGEQVSDIVQVITVALAAVVMVLFCFLPV